MNPCAPLILGCEGLELGREEAAFFADSQPFGFILFARNIETPDQTRALTEALRMSVGWDAPILVDQEGGRVQRMRAPHWREWVPPLDQMANGAGVRAMNLRYQIIAAELRAVGIDVNCAPQVDIARAQTHPFLRNRCYGETLADVVIAGRAVAEGLMAGGVLPVLKHMPGHGLGQLDSHLELPVADADMGTLIAHDFAAFKALSDLPMAMTAHLIFPAFDADRPATVSPVMIDVMRTQIGFEGLLMTDDISMQALSGTVAERGDAALKAGCDIVLHCNGNLSEMRTLAEGCGMMPKWSHARAKAVLARRRPAPQVDLAALDAAFAAEAERVTKERVNG